MQPKDNACVTCKKPLAGHYLVSAVDPQGTTKGTIQVCSIFCLVQWAYGFAARQGARGAMMVQAASKDPDMWKKLLKGLVDKL